MVLVQNWPFFHLFFQAIQARKKCFTIFQNEKTPLQAIKARSSKSRKIEIFVKGLTHGFGAKLTISPSVVFSQYRAGKCVLRYSRTEKMPFQVIKTTSLKSRKIEIFAKGVTHGFGLKFAIFPSFFIQALQGRKMCFTIFQNEKTRSQAIKTEGSKSGKIEIFAKGLNHGFGLKLAIFPSFFF